MDGLPCFICSIETVFYLRNFYKLKSKHSNTLVPEFLKTICGGEDFIPLSDVDNEDGESIVCMECMAKINDYDAACTTKERIEREFRVTLQRSKELRRNVDSVKSIEVKVESLADEENTDDAGCEYPFAELKEDVSQKSVESSDSNYDQLTEREESSTSVHTQEIDESPNQKRSRSAFKKRTNKASAEKKSKFSKISPATKIGTKSRKNPLKCPICAIYADDEESLSEHKALHEGKPLLQCIVCDNFFNNKSTLGRHTRIHIGEKNFQCERCGKSFMHPSSLQMHIKAHEDIRDKHCPHCPLQFRSTSHLNRHIRIHTGSKPYSCPKCQQRFAQRYNMTVHLRLHDSTEKSKVPLKHVCTICESAFARPSKLAEHYCRAHETMMPHANGNEVEVVNEPSSD